MQRLRDRRSLPLFLLVIAVSVALPAAAFGQFYDGFEDYEIGAIAGLGGWENWDDLDSDPFYTNVNDSWVHDGEKSLGIRAPGDIVQAFDGEFVGGRWAVTLWVYVTASNDGAGYVILLNTYNAGAGLPKDWSTQVLFDFDESTVSSEGGSGFTMPGTADLLTHEWMQLYVDIDLDANTQTIYLDGKELASGPWTSTGTPTIECVDLYGHTAMSEFFVDDVQIVPDCNGNAIDDAVDIAGGESEDCDEDGIPDECQEATIADSDTITASDASLEAAYGCAVAIDGDRMVVGAHMGPSFAPGAAYVYEWSGAVWVEKQKLSGTAPPLAELGFSVAISGDVIVAGARKADDCCNNSGAAYVFRFDGTTWEQEQKLDAGTDASEDDEFGYSVAVDGDRCVVGAWIDDGVALQGGAAYVFHYSSGTWSLEDTLAPAELDESDQFGRSVAIAGDWIFAGAQGDDDAELEAGAVYVFHRSGTDWVLEEKLLGSDADDRFGESVAASGNIVVIGASEVDPSGAAYVFRLNDAGVWSEEGIPVPDDAAAGDGFGIAVAVRGDRIAVGAAGGDDEAGSVYIFSCTGDAWTQQGKLRGPGIELGDRFGFDVALGAATYVGGAERDDTAATNAGAIQSFSLRDCDGDDVLDACQIAADPTLDLDDDRILDACASDVQLCTQPPPEPAGTFFKRGDANDSGAVDPLPDAVRLLTWGFLGGAAPPCLCAADADGNGNVVPLLDALRLLNWGFVGGAVPPAPGPKDCGEDPDEPALCDLNDVTTAAEACGTTTGHGRNCEP